MTTVDKVRYLHETLHVTLNGLSQDLGVHPTTLSSWLNGDYLPSEKWIKQVEYGLHQIYVNMEKALSD